MKRSVASFVLQRKGMFSKKRTDPIRRDGMRVVFSCSVQEQIPSIINTVVAKGTNSFQLRRVIPTAVHPYKQGG